MQGIALTLKSSSTVQYYISWRNLADLENLGFELEFMNISAATKMRGSGKTYSAYFYKVPAKRQSRRGANKAETCTKHGPFECRCDLVSHSLFALSEANNSDYTFTEYTNSLKKSTSKRSGC